MFKSLNMNHKYTNITLTHQENENDFPSQEDISLTQNLYSDYPIDLNFQIQNDSKTEKRPLLYHYFSPFLINNININQGLERLGKVTNASTNEYQINKLDLFTFKKKKTFFNVQHFILSSIDNSSHKETKLLQKKKNFGRKKKEDQSHREHDKFSDDNIRRKCKRIILENIREFINNKIYEIYDGNIGGNIFRKELLTLNKNQIAVGTVNSNKEFLSKTLGEIFSDTISSRFTTFPPKHNESLIKRLMNEEDEEKRKYFQKLFNLTFLQCLKHFREENEVKEIDGLKSYREIKKNLNEGKEYILTLDYYIQNFEYIIYNKKERISKKKIKEEIKFNSKSDLA